eukprot:13919660-Ditylum_brightwellii.AAC.1
MYPVWGEFTAARVFTQQTGQDFQSIVLASMPAEWDLLAFQLKSSIICAPKNKLSNLIYNFVN